MMNQYYRGYPNIYSRNVTNSTYNVDYWNYTNIPISNYPHSNMMNPFVERFVLTDQGPHPYVVNMAEAIEQNNSFRMSLWTGNYMQMTLMVLAPGEDIGLEMHPYTDQYIHINDGEGLVQMKRDDDNNTFIKNIYQDYSIFIPAGTWHNVTNTGNNSMKLYSIYSPPHHAFGTIHATKWDAKLAARDGISY